MIVDKEPEDAAESVGDEGEEGGVIGFCCRCWFGYTLLRESAKVDVAAGVSGAIVETEVELKLRVDMDVDGVEAEDMVIIGEGSRIPSRMEGFGPLPPPVLP